MFVQYMYMILSFNVYTAVNVPLFYNCNESFTFQIYTILCMFLQVLCNDILLI